MQKHTWILCPLIWISKIWFWRDKFMRVIENASSHPEANIISRKYREKPQDYRNSNPHEK
jgi:hypothetical protein